jgi:choline dehydrogenase
VGVREFILDTIAAGYPLTLKTRSLATRVLFDRSGPKPKAVGIGWLEGPNLYEASPLRDPSRAGVPRRIRVTNEVIVSAGTFNTPQLLKLSGIGPRAELAAHGIETVVNLPGVGRNLQDRYEVPVIGEVSSTLLGDQFQLLKDCSLNPKLDAAQLEKDDPCFRLWQRNVGVYPTNGIPIAVIRRSNPALKDPDLLLFGLPGLFNGYFPGYSGQVESEKKQFTWVVLKAHTNNNNAGTVTLKSSDPRVRPNVDFRYFTNGEEDLQASVEGVLFARRLLDKARELSPSTDGLKEVAPGPTVDTREKIAQYVKDTAWGHHACCTAKIGNSKDRLSVLDSRFRVRGTEGLRVVDASVFPKIPGLFVAVPTYMISEKAADVIHEDSVRNRPAPSGN